MNQTIVKHGIMAAAVLGALGLAAPAKAQQFTADVVDLAPDGSPRAMGNSGKLSVSDGKVRIDRAEASGTWFLVEPAKSSALVVAPLQRLYMDAKQSSILTELMVPVDPVEPCTQWQAMATVAGDTGKDGHGTWRCEAAGTDTVDGRPAVKVTMTSPRGDRRTGWIDARLKFPIRIAASDGSVIALRDIVEEAPAGGLFEVPASFRKYDPAQLIARIKQSDVWVEPPK